MMALGPHADYIIASYVAWAIILGGLTLWIILRKRSLQRTFDALKASKETKSASRPVAPTKQN